MAETAVNGGDFDFKGITLSNQQHEYAANRVNGDGQIALEDYRHQTGLYDHIVSIEMFEAVGEQYWNTYFSKIKSLLKKGGQAVVQTITIEDHRFEDYRRGSDMIRSYIFPGGMLPSVPRFNKELKAVGLKSSNMFSFGQDYAQTLLEWLKNFDNEKNAVKKLGFDESFIKLWRFYLAACYAGFKSGRTDVMQINLEHA
jgi:cyclopropane-fatty-acyl-phospholipid synthase